MKRILCFVLTALLLFTLSPFALADDSVSSLNPVLSDGHPEDHAPPVPEFTSAPVLYDITAFQTDRQYYDGILTISISEEGDYFSGVTWQASTTGGNGNYFYEFTIVQPVENNGTTTYYYKAGQTDGSSDFSYTFTDNGSYELWVDVQDIDQNIWARRVLEISVQEAGHDPLALTVSMSGAFFTQPTTWTVNATGGSGSYQYYIELCSLDIDDALRTVTYNQGFREDNTMTYRFLASGNYELRVWVKDSKGKEAYGSFSYSPASAAYPSVTNKVSALVAECASAGCTSDYEKALWLHDWLTSQANYDLSYSHYGPDGVLFGGTGVCDSYSKAYMLLLTAAGIDAERVTNPSHSWNVILIDREWYYVDATWDDPVDSEAGATGGLEHHHYFCIPDEILGMDHFEYISPHDCHSYAYNYYVQNGEGAAWASAFAPTVEAALQAGDVSFTVTLPAYYRVEGRTYSGRENPVVVLADAVMLLLSDGQSYRYGNERVPLHICKENSRDINAVAQVITDGKALVLPSNLTKIETEAFQNTAFMSVVIPATVTQIDSAAFAGCGSLWLVSIPSSVVSFGENIFDTGNTHLTLSVEQGSPAAQYAASHGLKYTFSSYTVLQQND